MQEIYNAIIKQIVLDILRDSCINQICAEIDITSDDIIAEIERVGHKKTNKPRKDCTLDQYRHMLSDAFKDRFNPDCKHCLFFLGGRTNVEPEEMYTFCGVYTGYGIVCSKHLKTNEGKRLKEEWETEKFNSDTHHANKTKARFIFAKGKLKRLNDIPLFMKVDDRKNRLMFVRYDHQRNCMYNKDTGLIVTLLDKKHTNKIITLCVFPEETQYETIGIDENNDGHISKISVKKLRELKNLNAGKGINVGFYAETMEDDLINYLHKKRNQK